VNGAVVVRLPERIGELLHEPERQGIAALGLVQRDARPTAVDFVENVLVAHVVLLIRAEQYTRRCVGVSAGTTPS
jgi:hypothetical protein